MGVEEFNGSEPEGSDDTDGGFRAVTGKMEADEADKDPWQVVYCLTKMDRPWQALCVDKVKAKMAKRKRLANDDDKREQTNTNEDREPRYVDMGEFRRRPGQQLPADREVAGSKAQPPLGTAGESCAVGGGSGSCEQTAIQVDGDSPTITYRYSYMAAADELMMSLDSQK